MARTPVLPEVSLVGALSAQLRRPRLRFVTSAIRRLRPSPAQRCTDGVDGDKRTIWPWRRCSCGSIRGLMMRSPILLDRAQTRPRMKVELQRPVKRAPSVLAEMFFLRAPGG